MKIKFYCPPRLSSYLLLILVLFSPCYLAAQETLNVTGVVVDQDTKQPLAGVSILLKGKNSSTSSNADGKYTIQANLNDVLIYSYVGYETGEAIVKSNTLNFSLVGNLSELEEVVVIGYGTVKKSSSTAAISKVENKQLDQIPAGRPETALVGQMAGVNISTTRSTPGAAPIIRIRGAGSISASNNPLIVIDGFPGGSFSDVSMNDIESIEVLKDASSAAIYGSRGSGGVIIVTTKKGKTGKPKLNFNAYAGVANAMGHDDWIKGEEYYDYVVRYQNREYAWADGDVSIPVWGDPRRPTNYQVNPVIKEGNENWENNVLHSAPIQNYNLSISGGTDNVNYYVSGTIKDEEGTVINTSYKNYSARANVNVKVNSFINTGFMLSPSYTKRRTAPLSMEAMVKMPPFVEVQNPDGTYPRARDYWGAVVSGGMNPMAVLNGSKRYTTTMSNIGDMYVDVNIIEGLNFRASAGVNTDYTTLENYAAAYTTSNLSASGSANDTRSLSFVNENVLSYTKQLNENHNLSGILGASFQKTDTRNAPMVALSGSFGNDIIETLNNAIINPNGTYTSKSQWGLISYFGRVNYDFQEKYLLSASLRTDGSSRFGPESQWGYFPSASVAWRVSEEEFMKDITAISNLKLRASYGVVGNFNIGDFQYLGNIADVFYSADDELTKGQTQSTLGDPGLKWEKTISYDFGIEVGLISDRLNFVFDYYDKKTTDLLYNVATPATTGFTSTLSNVGDIGNRGIELELNSKNLIGDFKWQTAFNLTVNKNKVLDLGGVNERLYTDTYGMSWLLRVGEPMFSYFGYESIGVLQNQDDIENSAVMEGSKPGNTKYLDRNKDGVIDPKDRSILGNYQPKMFLGMVNNFSWKNFDMNIIMQASIGAKIYNFENEYYQGALAGAMRRSLVETQWWSEAEPGNGKMPGAALSMLTFQSNSDVYIEDATFLTIRNLNLGYTLPQSITDKLKLGSCRVYTSISNLLMITKDEFHGYNPEGYTKGEINGINSLPGYNSGSEPINRIFSFGVNMNF